MKRNILLVTGGLGFIGSKLLNGIENEYDLILIVDSLNPFVHKNKLPTFSSRCKVISGKVEDARTWDYVLESINFEFESMDVVHLASETSTGLSLARPSWHTNPNVNGSSLLIEFLDKFRSRIRKIILSSSRAVYGEGAWVLNGDVVYPNTRSAIDLNSGDWKPKYGNIFCESFLPSSAAKTQTNPCNIYGVTKLTQEQLIQIWGRSHNVQTIVLRFQNVYGPGQSLENGYSGILAFFVKEALGKRFINVYERGDIVRDFVYVDDVVASIVASLRTRNEDAFVGDIGTGLQTTIFEIAEIICEQLAVESPRRVDNYRLGDVRAAACDPTTTQEFLKVKCEIRPEQGIAHLIDWAKGEHISK
jgi:dTDP-L-rhamnose 4-epimerase